MVATQKLRNVKRLFSQPIQVLKAAQSRLREVVAADLGRTPQFRQKLAAAMGTLEKGDRRAPLLRTPPRLLVSRGTAHGRSRVATAKLERRA